MSEEISLRPITRENWRECAVLSVAPDQQNFVAPNSRSLLQYLYQDPTDTFEPFGIYAGETMVGFMMYGMGEFGGLTGWEIWRLMIDQRYQKKGYGRKALQLSIDLMRERLQVDELYIMFELGNDVARDLYTSVGFQDTGIIDDDEHVYKLTWTKE